MNDVEKPGRSPFISASLGSQAGKHTIAFTKHMIYL